MIKTISQLRAAAALSGINLNPFPTLWVGVKKFLGAMLCAVALWAFVTVLFCMGCSQAHAQERATQSSCVARALENIPEQNCITSAASQKSCDSCVAAYRAICARAAASCSLSPSETREICNYYAPLESCGSFGATWE